MREAGAILLVLCAAFCGCNRSPEPDQSATVATLEKRVAAIEAELKTSSESWQAQARANALWKKGIQEKLDSAALEKYQSELILIKDRLTTLELRKLETDGDFSRRLGYIESRSLPARLNIDQKGYAVVETKLGTFFVTVRDVQPYLDGFRLKIGIGNPQAVLYAGLKLTISYPALRQTPSMVPDTPPEMMPDSDKWEFFTSPLTEQFSPAKWTPITVEIPKITLPQLREAVCSLEANEIILGR